MAITLKKLKVLLALLNGHNNCRVSVTTPSGDQVLLDIDDVQYVPEVNEVVIFAKERR
jgi:hypothetical protein